MEFDGYPIARGAGYAHFHWISQKHIDASLSEMCYRWNRRDMAAGERVNDFLAPGRRPADPHKALIA